MHKLLEFGERGFLLTDIGRLIHKVFEQKASGLGYIRPHWQILAHLTQTPGMMQATLADHLEMEPITLSRHLDRMEGEGVVERRLDPKDRRVKRLYLTPRADEQMVELVTVRDEVVTAIFRSVPKEHEETIRKVLQEIRRNLMEMETR